MKKLSIGLLAIIFLMPCGITATALHDACKAGNLQEAKKLIGEGAKVDYRNIHGETPLHCAAKKGREKVVQELTAAPLLLNKSNNANSKLSKKTLKKDDNSKDEFVRLFKELPEPALKSVAKGLFPVKDNDEPIIKALLKFSYQHLKENPEQQQSSFASLFIHEFYNYHLLKLKLYIAIKNYYQCTAIIPALFERKDAIVHLLKDIEHAPSYDYLNEDLRTQTERNYLTYALQN